MARRDGRGRQRQGAGSNTSVPVLPAGWLGARVTGQQRRTGVFRDRRLSVSVRPHGDSRAGAASGRPPTQVLETSVTGVGTVQTARGRAWVSAPGRHRPLASRGPFQGSLRVGLRSRARHSSPTRRLPSSRTCTFLLDLSFRGRGGGQRLRGSGAGLRFIPRQHLVGYAFAGGARDGGPTS